MFLLAEQATKAAAEVAEKTDPVAVLTFVDYYAIGAYMVLMVAVGVLCRNNSDDISDYIRMGGKSTWWMAGLSVFMASFSCATFTGYAAQGYLGGFSFVLNFWLVAFMFFVQAAFFAPWMRNTRAVTPPDAIRLRFGPAIEQFTMYTGLLSSFVWGGVFLWTLATFCSTVFGFEIRTVIVVVGIVILFYSVSGGSWSVQITDNLQSFLLIPVTIVMAGLALYEVGGVKEMFNQIELQGLEKDFAMIVPTDHVYSTTTAKVKPMFFTVPWLIAMIITQLFAAANMRTCYRYLSIKNGSDARKSAALAGGLIFLGSFIWVLPVIVARLKFSADIEGLPLKYPADGAYAIAASKLLPSGMLGLVIVAMFSATMSSLDSNLTGTAGNLTKNMYVPLARVLGFKPLEGRALMTLTKWVNFFLGVWAIGVALLFDKISEAGIFGAMVMILALIGMPVSMPFLVSFFMKKIPFWGPVVGTVFGLGMSAIMKFNPGDILQNLDVIGLGYFNMVDANGEARNPYWHEIAFSVSFTALIPTIATRVFWFTAKDDYKQRVNFFFKQINTPVDVEEENKGEIDHSLLKTVGGLGLITSLIVLPMIFVADSTPGRIAAIFVFGFIFLITGGMYLKGKKADNMNSDDSDKNFEPLPTSDD